MKLPVTYRNGNTIWFNLIILTVCGLRLPKVRVFVIRLFACSEKEVVFSGNKWCLLWASVTPSLRAPQVSGLLLQGL